MFNILISFIASWALILLLAFSVYSISKMVIKSQTSSLILGLVLSPILISQLLFVLYKYFPKYPHNFYPLMLFILILGIGVIVFNRKKLNLDFSIKNINPTRATYFYLISIGFIVIVTFLRTVFWPLIWYDQTEYYAVAHSYYFQREALNHIANPLRAEDGVVVGIRPAIPVLINYFALFSRNNIFVEKQLMLSIFYYFLMVLFIFYTIARKIKATTNGTLFGIFLLTTCFFFINFTIFGFKEIIIIALGLSVVSLFIEIQKKQSNHVFVAVIMGILLGSMSFLHFTGIVVAILMLISFTICTKSRMIHKGVFCAVAFWVSWQTSLGETKFFTEWALQGLFTPPALSTIIDFKPVSESIQNINKKELQAFGISDTLDRLIKGRLQAITQIQSFGVVYWVVLVGLISNVKNIYNSRARLFIAMFGLAFVAIVSNSLSLISHTASYVFLVSPKYYLLLLPFLLLLIINLYDKMTLLLIKVPKRFLTLVFFFIAVLASILLFHPLKVSSAIENFIPLQYNTHTYYISQITEIGLYYLITSTIALVYLLVSKKLDISIVEILFSCCVFLIPFIFVFNNNFDISEIFTTSMRDRNKKISVINNNQMELYEVFAALAKSHKDGEKVLLLTPGQQAQFNYYLITQHNKFFSTSKIHKYIETKESESDTKYHWIIRNNDDKNEIPDNYEIYHENLKNQLLRIKHN